MVYFFQAGVPFSTENTEGTVYESLFREYNTQNTIYTNQKNQARQLKYQEDKLSHGLR